MLWSRTVLEVHRSTRLDRLPDVLVLHVGGNDLGLRSLLNIVQDIKFDFLWLRLARSVEWVGDPALGIGSGYLMLSQGKWGPPQCGWY